LRGRTSKNDTIHTNIQINGPKLVIFSHTGSPQMKISQKVFFWGGATFLTHTVWPMTFANLETVILLKRFSVYAV